MGQGAGFHDLDAPVGGIARDLAPGMSATIVPGEGAMLSVVVIAPNATGVLHRHPEEQWGVLPGGSAIRMRGDEAIAVAKGDAWRRPGGVPHAMRAGPAGAAGPTSSPRRGRTTGCRARASAPPDGHREGSSLRDPRS
ncbi:cupin domain-containing protein [Paracraurococcus ruber]|uniref:cupin domain-containing protein n=1 Tax=Paracraurococcus ruber TaxID=77675 RepID=UPI00190483D8|nr:cupin domain-containing protein [Paracraurococcus ruber]